MNKTFYEKLAILSLFGFILLMYVAIRISPIW